MSHSSHRIISLVPSLSETVDSLGLFDQIVGCTQFCVHPANLRHKECVGGTKNPDISRILQLKPTHILVNFEENRAEDILKLQEYQKEYCFQVIMTKIVDVHDVQTMILDFGSLFSCEEKAEKICQELSDRSQSLKLQNPVTFSYLYFIWRDPWMVAGDQTYISKILELANGKNLISTSNALDQRYPTISLKDPRIALADVCFFSSEPFPFKERHIEEFLSSATNPRKTSKIDGRLMSWYGSATATALAYLTEKIDKWRKDSVSD